MKKITNLYIAIAPDIELLINVAMPKKALEFCQSVIMPEAGIIF